MDWTEENDETYARRATLPQADDADAQRTVIRASEEMLQSVLAADMAAHLTDDIDEALEVLPAIWALPLSPRTPQQSQQHSQHDQLHEQS
ncbi:hypothetical protein LRAMOSA11326 [Lichtheimia ramosa]|uniref:Uncharacterized protein n=1 Tax=Lichtheimia ramosa TaxID=688394 RepID=A0A077WU29_9FUNG|nr:hypothetical protein LRAMOSA11326 [Lichtheimia ramosa]